MSAAPTNPTADPLAGPTTVTPPGGAPPPPPAMGGGAGLGMVKVYHSTVSTLYDVVRGRKTEVTGVFELDMNLREFRTLPKSVHFFQNG